MGKAFSTYQYNVYSDFQEIDPDNFREVVLFYEENEESLLMLDQKDLIHVQITYSDALFELGKYHRYLTVVDELIETVIDQNIFYFNQEDIFQKLLFKKGASLYHSHLYKESQKVLWELIKINPYHQLGIYLYRFSQVKQIPRALQLSRNVALAMALITVVLIAVELLYIRQHQAEQVTLWENSRNGLFLCSVGLLLTSDLIHRGLIFRKVYKEVDTLKKVKG